MTCPEPDMTRRERHVADQIEYWTSKVAEYRSKLAEAQSHLHEAKVAAAPFQVGDVVEARMWGRNQEFTAPAIVRGVKTGYDGWRVSFRRKDGEWSKAERRVAEVRAYLCPQPDTTI